MACSTVLTRLVILLVLLFPVPVSNTWNHPAMFSDTGLLDPDPVWRRDVKPLSVFDTRSTAELRRPPSDQPWPGPNDDTLPDTNRQVAMPSRSVSQDWRNRLRWMQDEQQMDRPISRAKI